MKQKIEGGKTKPEESWENELRGLLSVKSKYATPILNLIKIRGQCPFCNFQVKYPHFPGANRGVVRHIIVVHKEVKGRVELVIDLVRQLVSQAKVEQRREDVAKIRVFMDIREEADKAFEITELINYIKGKTDD